MTQTLAALLSDCLARLNAALGDGTVWETSCDLAASLGANSLDVFFWQGDNVFPDWARTSKDMAFVQAFDEQGLHGSNPFLHHRRALPASYAYDHAGPHPWGAHSAETQRGLDLLRDYGYRMAHLHQYPAPGGTGACGVSIWAEEAGSARFAKLGLQASSLICGLIAAFVPPPGSGETPPFLQFGSKELTETEIDTLNLIAQGLRNAEIAHRMGVAEVTVRLRINNARKKLNAATREQALILAMARGLLLR